MSATEDQKGVALAFMKRASRDTFRVCAKQAEDLAARIEDGELRLDAPSALRMLAIILAASADYE